jgi:hypothetical protein
VEFGAKNLEPILGLYQFQIKRVVDYKAIDLFKNYNFGTYHINK